VKKKIKLVSLSRFLSIGITGGILIPIVVTIFTFRNGFTAEMFFGSYAIGFLFLILLLKLTIYYSVVVDITDEYVWIGKRKLDWKVIKSYDYDETPLFGKLILRDKHGLGIKILGKLKGKDSVDFLLLVDTVINKIDGINENDSSKRIEKKNFYNSKLAKPFAYGMIIFAVLLTAWAIFQGKEPNNIIIMRLTGFYLLLSIFLLRIFKEKG
jgi:hypothetical protein